MKIRPGSGITGSLADLPPRLRMVGAIPLMLAVAVLLASCGGGSGSDSGESENGGSEETTSQGTEASISTIIDQPGEFDGQTVTVSGRIALVPSATTFMVIPQETYDERKDREGTLFDNPQELSQNGVLVTTEGSQSTDRAKFQSVRVTGQVRQFDRQTFQEEYSGDYSSGVFNAFSDKPAIVASEVQQMGGGSTTGG